MCAPCVFNFGQLMLLFSFVQAGNNTTCYFLLILNVYSGLLQDWVAFVSQPHLLRYVQRNMSDINRVSDWCCDLPVIGQWSHTRLDSVSHALINGPCLHRHGQWLRGYSYLLLVVSSDKWCAVPPMCALCAWCHPYIKPHVIKLYSVVIFLYHHTVQI